MSYVLVSVCVLHMHVNWEFAVVQHVELCVCSVPAGSSPRRVEAGAW